MSLERFRGAQAAKLINYFQRPRLFQGSKQCKGFTKMFQFYIPFPETLLPVLSPLYLVNVFMKMYHLTINLKNVSRVIVN